MISRARKWRASKAPARDISATAGPLNIAWLDGAGIRRHLLQCRVCPRSVIVAQVAPDNSPQVRFAEYDDVIEALPAKGSDYSLRVRILPGAVRRNDDFLDVERLHTVLRRQPVHAIPRMVKKFSRRAKALRRAGRGMESTRFPVELVCIKRRVGEEVMAADWPTCRRRGWRVPRPDFCRMSSGGSRHGSQAGNHAARR